MYIEVNKNNDKYEVTPNVTPGGAIATYDPDMEVTDDQSGNYIISQTGKYYCYVGMGDTYKELFQVQGDGTTSISDLLDNLSGDSAAWCYCGSCGDYGFYYPYRG